MESLTQFKCPICEWSITTPAGKIQSTTVIAFVTHLAEKHCPNRGTDKPGLNQCVNLIRSLMKVSSSGDK